MAAPPAHWSCDVVLVDGGTVHVRPITPADAPALVAFHSRLSSDTQYLRFFSAKPRLTEAEVSRFTTVDHDDRVALVAVLGSDLVGVARYDRTASEPASAEVAFVVADEHHGRGVGTVLLEHLAAAARERGITRFRAETLPVNRPMLSVFRTAGFEETTRLDEGVVVVEMAIEPTDRSRAAVEEREHRAEARSIARLLTPRSVAVVGASRDPATVGHQVLRNLLAGGFHGPVYPVNPHADHVASVPAHRSVLDVPGTVDLAVVAVPGPAVRSVVEQCAAKGVAGLVVLSAGFGEVGAEGAAAQVELREMARRHGMRLVGPNCIGVANTAVGLDATFSPYPPAPGRIAMQSQSGAVGIAILERSARVGLGVSSFVSVGNKADVSGNDLLQYWEDDPGTDVVLLYLESFGNPRKFSRIARRVSRRKPIVAVKSGRSGAGVRAASSHTAAMASADVAVDALFHQTGVIRVDTLDELFDMAMVLGSQPLPGGRRVAIVTNSGGPGILATDACEGAGLQVPELSEATQAVLRRLAGPNAAVGNPVDLVAGATPSLYHEAIAAVVADPDVDAVLVVSTPTFAAPPEQVAAMVCQAAAGAGKPVVASFLAWPAMPPLLRPPGARAPAPGPGRRSAQVPGPVAADDPGGGGAGDPAGGEPGAGRAGEAEPAAVPAFASPEPGVRALARAARYAEWRRRPPGAVPPLAGFDPDAARSEVVAHLDRTGPGWLPPETVASVLRHAGVPWIEAVTVGSAPEAGAAAAAAGRPVALKAVGPDLLHKSDVGGVRLGLDGAAEVEAAFAEMAARLGERMQAALVQPMAGPGVETIMGMVLDPLFGPLVLFGLGGVATELLGDRSLRILPLTDADAAELVRSLRSSPLLFGYRGAPPVDVAALEELLQRLGRLAALVPEVAELDLNPVMATASGAEVVDARIRVAPAAVRRDDVRRLG